MRALKILMAAMLAALLLPLGGAWAQAPVPAPDGPLMNTRITEALRRGRVLLNFENIDIRVLARMMAELTGRNLVLDDRVQGRVTVLSSREVTPAEAWDIFQTALQRYGFTVSDRGDYVQVLPVLEARRTSRVLAPGTAAAPGEDLVMAILILRHANPDIIQNSVRPLVSDTGVLLPYKEGRALIVAERAAVVSRISEVVRALDKLHPTTHTSVVFPKHAEAEKLVPILQQMFQGNQESKFLAFGPANAVVILGSAQQIQDAKRLLERLDIPAAAPTKIEPPRFYVYNLQFAQAEEVARILSEILQEKQRLTREQEENKKSLALPPMPPPDAGRMSANSAALDRPMVPSPTSSPSPFPDATGVVPEPRTLSFVSAKVSAEPETNSLVLFVSPSEYEGLRAVIARLDLERRQVQISAVVAEVSLRRVRDVGVNWQAMTSGGVVGSFRGGLTEEGLLSHLASGHFVVGAVGPNTRKIKVGGQEIQVPEFFAFLSALQDNSDFNLISAPRVMTQDNKEAIMNVGQVVPFATGGRLDAFGQPLVTFDYREVGIKLQVTPHVSQNGKIRMDIDQEIQEVTDYLQQEMAGVGFSAPIVSNRNVKTTVTVGNGETLLIGGLISKRTVDAVRGVPILKDLPLLGGLFRQKSTDEQKTTVFISITPQIVDADKELERLDQPFAPYVESEGNPGDQQPEDRETRPSPKATGSAPALPGLCLQDFGFPQDVGPGRSSRPFVTVRNQESRPLELVLVGTVERPDGQKEALENLPLTLGVGEERQVYLPRYTFPNLAGVYRFDVLARYQDRDVTRLPNPWQLELPGPPVTDAGGR
ncbi:MAG: type II secretion system secretin GspD [Candidatus Xenobium sp.]|nr:type II secretion system secretin GspD [Burkholderiales bacterium]